MRIDRETGASTKSQLDLRAAWHLDHLDAWKDLGSNFRGEPLPRIVSQRRMVAVGQHAIYDAPLVKRRPEGLGHVRKILPHLLGVDAAHEPVVLDLDRRDVRLVEQLAEHHQPVLEEGVALRRRQVRGPRGDGAREPRPGTAHHLSLRHTLLSSGRDAPRTGRCSSGWTLQQ